MQAKEFYILFEKELKGIYSLSELKRLIEILLEDLLHIEKSKRLVSDFDLNTVQVALLQNAMVRLKKQEPVQYITGVSHFMDFTLKVNSHVLIPRPETEELVEWVTMDIKNKRLNVIDVGTGSGCIAIALKKMNPTWNVTGIDISKEAVNTAQENAATLQLPVNFEFADMTTAEFPSHEFDLIVSNPPYITYGEKELMAKNVIDYEPHLALFEPVENEFHFYKAILSFAKKHLALAGFIFVELNQDKALDLRDLFAHHFENVELKKDISGNYRFLKAW